MAHRRVKRPRQLAPVPDLGVGRTKDILNPHLDGIRTVAVSLDWLSGDGQEEYDSANADC